MMAEIFNAEMQWAAYDKASKAEAREEGIEIGKIEEKRNTALSMLADNEPIEKIAKHTGLSLETINELKGSMNSKELAKNRSLIIGRL